MRSILALSIALCLGLTLPADDKKKPERKPNTLTEQEARDGWLLLFDGKTTFGWELGDADAEKPEATVKDGQLALVCGKHKTYALSTTRFRYFDLSFDYRTEGSEDASVSVHVPGHGWTFGLQGATGPRWGSATVRFSPDGRDVRIDQPAGKPLVDKGKLPSPFGPCTITFSPDHAKVGALFLRNVKLRPLGLAALFNGKDLTDWKEHKGKKSKFTVTKEGWLNVKDGPGDLQTEKLFGDFVLRLECISNGKHLNSGLFFRCIPGEYQNGYEAQIHNQFDSKPPRRYTVEVYDPVTHKRVGKKTVESSAKDWGTGAIYRRVPARAGVAKDGEWFTMTVVARGRHFATWVNGVQQVDWTDNRPDDTNPRKGYRAEPGAISIQGHDPTTDLSFRNILIGELPRVKK